MSAAVGGSISVETLGTGHSLRDLLDLEQTAESTFRSTVLHHDEHDLYGGRLVALALAAGGRTVAADRAPHSLHCYFLRPGAADEPLTFVVEEVRDGRSYSHRRVLAEQRGKTIFTANMSFQQAGVGGPQSQHEPAPRTESAADATPFLMPRLDGFSTRRVAGVDPDLEWPNRFWARCEEDPGSDALLHACVLAHLSDISTGLSLVDVEGFVPQASIDHTIWFHRSIRVDQWLLVDALPIATGGGRGVYRQSIHDESGQLLATVMQEAVFRPE